MCGYLNTPQLLSDGIDLHTLKQRYPSVFMEQDPACAQEVSVLFGKNVLVILVFEST